MFLAQSLLLGGLAAGIPVALHFFYRSRYRVVPWAAMEFLLTSIQQTSRRLKFQELLLLLLRVDLLLLLALALARPTFSALGVTQPLDVVLVMDNSYSMGTREGTRTRLEIAQAEALKLIDGLPPSSTVQVVTCSDTAALLGPTTPANLDQARGLVKGLRLTALATDFQPGFEEAAKALERVKHHPNREVYLFSDLQKLGWDRQAGTLRDRVDALRAADRTNARLVLVRCGTQEPANAAVVGIVPLSGIPHTGERASFTVLVRNTGKQPISNLNVTLEVDGRKDERDSRAIEKLEPGEVRPVPLTGLLKRAGRQVVTARIEPDALDADNRFDYALNVRERVRVLLIDGSPSDDPVKSAGFVLRNVLQPVPPTLRDKYHIEVRTETLRTVSPALLADRDVCILTDVPAAPVQLPEDRKRWQDFLTRLEGFVEEGHGLLIFAGPNVEPGAYNKVLADERHLLPLYVGKPYDAPETEPASGDPDSVEPHSFLAAFREPPYAIGLRATPVGTVLETQPLRGGAAEGTQVVMRYTDHRVAVASRAVGRGQVVLFTMNTRRSWTADGEPNNGWALNAALMIPLVHMTLNHVVEGQAEELNRTAGQPLTWSPPRAEEGRPHDLTTPLGEEIHLGMPLTRGGRAQLQFRDTAYAGVYRLAPSLREEGGSGVPNLDPEPRLGRATAGTVFAVTPDLRESEDLSSLSDQEIDERLGAGVVHWVAGRDNPGSAEDRLKHEWTPWLLGAVLALALVETILAWFCGRERLGWVATVFLVVGAVVVLPLTLGLVAAYLVGLRWLGLALLGAGGLGGLIWFLMSTVGRTPVRSPA